MVNPSEPQQEGAKGETTHDGRKDSDHVADIDGQAPTHTDKEQSS